MRRTRLTAAALAACLLATGAPAALAKHDKTYASAKTACRSLPLDKLTLALGLSPTATNQQIAAAYAKHMKTKAAKKSAKAGCLAGLKARS